MLLKFLIPLRNVVKIPDKIIIIPCPNEKERSINPANSIFFVKVAKLMIPANIGVEQGLEAKANKIPTKKMIAKKLKIFPESLSRIYKSFTNKLKKRVLEEGL